ncbi:hypothetical protein PLICRDRAFT_697054 [Plicaturopsis crispa FD-325 SS-3]|nr:hypothetical protein PLICRDRAFT_697054 [Plicaturopsis crispa FD-325 SS-3]
MDGNGWYGQHQQQPLPQDQYGSGGPDTIMQDAHRLLAVYPMASATPSSHVSRHLNNLAITTGVPSYIQPHHYSLQNSSYAPGIPTQYTEYASEIDYLASNHTPANDSGYWENARDDAVRFLGDQSAQQYTHYSPNPHWPQSHGSPGYQTSAFAQSVLQRTAPATAYPTPPPPSMTTSSSSLAFALGNPEPRPSPKVYQPEQSNAFFNDFLSQKTQEMNSRMTNNFPQRPATPPPSVPPPPQESPDPLDFVSTATAPAVTPRKRKSAAQLQTPSLKRVQSSYAITTSPLTPQGSATATPTSSKSKTTPRMRAYVEVPALPKAWLTPSSQKRGASSMSAKLKGKMKEEDDDLGGYGSEDELDLGYRQDSVKSSARRTGDRDERAPLEKLTALFEDIFEAEDSLPADIAVHDLPPEFFSSLTTEASRPHLQPTVIRKLTKYTGQVARPTKRLRANTAAGGTPRSKGGRMTDIDVTILSRVLKMLDRSVRAGEDLDPFIGAPAPLRPHTASPRKPKKTRKSKTPAGEEDQGSTEVADEDGMTADDEPPPPQQELTEVDLANLTRILEIARDSVLAAEACLALLVSDRLPKQLYSEELITICLSTIKNQLTKIVYPFVEASSDLAHAPPLLQHLAKPSSNAAKDHHRQLSEIFQALSAVLPRINSLVSAELVVMSDAIIIQAVYIAIGPFFVVETGGDADGRAKKDNIVLSTLGGSAMRGLRLDALSLIRSIFANHEDQRSWIIEEILSSLIKLSDTKQKAGHFRLRDGKSIRTVSALLLQLVQTSAHDVRIEAGKISVARQRQFALRRQESMNEKVASEPFLDEHDQEEIGLYTAGLESATKAAKTIILFLTQRSGKGKATKNSNEAEYRTIFDNLISDLLAVLYWPEWPAASLLLGIACKFMVSSLDDVKTTNQTDNNAAKTIALDHLGVIAARIRSSTLKVKKESPDDKGLSLTPLDEMLSSTDVQKFEKLLSTHQDVAAHLCKRSTEDQAYDSARELTAATWGQELALALKQVNVWITEPDSEEFDTMVVRANLLPFGQKIKNALREVWKDHATDVFDIGSQDEVFRIDRLALEIGVIQGLRNSFHPILNIILAALDAPPVFMRTKALRALGQIVTSDPGILAAPNVRRAIEGHLLDSSPAVRDAAVELIGKYMIDSPEVAGDYYQKIAERIADTGLGVRKRVIKLLKSFYAVTEDNSRRIDISTRLVLRMMDEDDTVKELAIKTIEELWFQVNLQPHSILKSRTQQAAASNPHDNGPLLSKVAVIMGVSANFKDRQSPLEDILHKIMADKEGTEAATLHDRYAEISETLIDGLVDASDLPGFTVINCIRTIHLFTSAYPAILSGTNASTLLPYLKNAATPDEQATSDYLLKIFRSSVPHMPKTAAKFGHELQLALQPMILKPSTAGGLTALQETVACMCTVVQYLTHDFARLVALVKSCNARLQQAIAKPSTQKMAPNEARALNILIFIVALLGEHCDFDRLRTENQAIGAELDTITKGSIIEHIYSSLLKLYEKYSELGLRGRVLQCLGFLFRAQPTLMTLDSSASIMDAIFASPEEEGRGRLLKIMQEFLVSEAAKHTAKEKESNKGKPMAAQVDMEELVGNTDGFADSGVSSAVVQRYLEPVLQAALSQHPGIQAAAIDVLSFTIKQGLAHPLQSFPVIVALETSPSVALSTRANALHAVLHSKHASLLNARYTISAKASFDYQKTLSAGQPVQGYRMQPTPTALMQRWYSLVREKRPSRQDFLKSLVKVFDVQTRLKSTQDELDFTRYMAENFSAFDYKTQEEVFTVIKYLTSVLSTAGMQLVEVLSPSHLLSQLHTSAVPQDDRMDTSGDEPVADDQAAEDKMPLMRSSVVIGMIMLLKAYLKELYGISEEKCVKFVVGKKSAIGDKAAVKRHERPISWERLPFAIAPILTSQDLDTQKSRFLDVWNEDGLTAEPEDDFA